MEFVVFKNQLSLYLDRDWEQDFLVKVLNDFENFIVIANNAEIPEVIVIDSDSKGETIESVSENVENKEINAIDSKDANMIVSSSDYKKSNTENGCISEEEADATESESEVYCSELCSGYGTLTFDIWMEFSLASSPEKNDEY